MTLIMAANSPKGKPAPEAILTTYHLLRLAVTQWLAWADLTELVSKALSPGGTREQLQAQPRISPFPTAPGINAVPLAIFGQTYRLHAVGLPVSPIVF